MTTLIDLRSDTITQPTDEMRRAMAEAEVGDDVYGEDPTVNRLQEIATARLGCAAALWTPSGTMANAIAIRLLTRPGQELLVGAGSHVVEYELAGMAQLSGVMPRVLPAPEGRLSAAQIEAAARPGAYYRSDIGAVSIENTHNLAGGTVYDVAQTHAVVSACRAAKLAVHLDGARLWNAAVALGVEPRELAHEVDTAMVDLSKGLGVPAGALLLLRSAERLDEARRVRKMLGGGMRQVGVLAAAAIVALDSMIDRLAEDHEHADILAAALARCPGLEVSPAPTNIVVARLGDGEASGAASRLAERGVRVSQMDSRTLRVVTHKDVSRADCERAAQIIEAVLGVERREDGT